MASIDFYIDIDRQERVKSNSDGSVVPIPTFTQGDTITFRIWPLQPTGNTAGSNPYTFISNSGRTLQFAIGLIGGASIYVSQYTWTGNSDPLNPYFFADVSFNTVELAAYLGTTAKQAYLEIKLIDSTPKTLLRKLVNLSPAVIVPTSPTPTPTFTPASMEAVRALLLNITTQSVTIQSANLAHSERLWIDNDATPHNDVT